MQHSPKRPWGLSGIPTGDFRAHSYGAGGDLGNSCRQLRIAMRQFLKLYRVLRHRLTQVTNTTQSFQYHLTFLSNQLLTLFHHNVFLQGCYCRNGFLRVPWSRCRPSILHFLAQGASPTWQAGHPHMDWCDSWSGNTHLFQCLITNLTPFSL